MIFWICLTAYILIGGISGKITYNKIFDEIYQGALNTYSNAGLPREEAEDRAYNFASYSSTPGSWGIAVFIVWPFYWFVMMATALFELVASLIDKIAPSKAYKAKVIRDKEKARKAELEEYEQALKVVQGE